MESVAVHLALALAVSVSVSVSDSVSASVSVARSAIVACVSVFALGVFVLSFSTPAVYISNLRPIFAQRFVIG